MSATNHTTNYELPIFVGTDKPAWLVDWNGAMTAIDTAIHTAEGKADQAGTDIGGIESSISTINSTLTSINSAVSQLRIDTNANTGSINTITSLIGNGLPTTTDKTIIGAINEIVDDFNLSSHVTATVEINTTYVGALASGSQVDILTNSRKTIGKVYGGLNLNTISGISGAGTYRLATLKNTGLPAIDDDYVIKIGYSYGRVSQTGSTSLMTQLHFLTSGNVDVEIITNGSVETDYLAVSLAPCLYFLKDLGD